MRGLKVILYGINYIFLHTSSFQLSVLFFGLLFLLSFFSLLSLYGTTSFAVSTFPIPSHFLSFSTFLFSIPLSPTFSPPPILPISPSFSPPPSFSPLFLLYFSSLSPTFYFFFPSLFLLFTSLFLRQISEPRIRSVL